MLTSENSFFKGKVRGYCLKGNVQITEVNKYFKEFIESLMDRHALKIKINDKTDPIEVNGILQSCIASTRNFKTIISWIVNSNFFFWDDRNAIRGIHKLFIKNSSTARTIEVIVESGKLSKVRKSHNIFVENRKWGFQVLLLKVKSMLAWIWRNAPKTSDWHGFDLVCIFIWYIKWPFPGPQNLLRHNFCWKIKFGCVSNWNLKKFEVFVTSFMDEVKVEKIHIVLIISLQIMLYKLIKISDYNSNCHLLSPNKKLDLFIVLIQRFFAVLLSCYKHKNSKRLNKMTKENFSTEKKFFSFIWEHITVFSIVIYYNFNIQKNNNLPLQLKKFKLINIKSKK